MPKYNVTGAVSGSKWLGVFEADSGEEAIEKALSSGETGVHLCHQCADQCEDGEITEAFASKV